MVSSRVLLIMNDTPFPMDGETAGMGPLSS